MRVNSQVQKIWLRLLGAPGSCPVLRIEKIEEGYYAVVRRAPIRKNLRGGYDAGDFRAVRPFIPHLARTRAVYLNQEGAYGSIQTESLQNWAGCLAEQVERGDCHAFAIVDTEAFSRKVSARLRASGWRVEQVQCGLCVSQGRLTGCVNLARAIVEMVLSRSTLAQAAQSVKSELAGRFMLDARLFARCLNCCEQNILNPEVTCD